MIRGFLSMPKTQNKTRKNPYNLRSSASSSDVMENQNSTLAPPHAAASMEVTSDREDMSTLGGGGPTVINNLQKPPAMETATAGFGGGDNNSFTISQAPLDPVPDEHAHPLNDEVDSHGGSYGSKKLDTVEDIEISLNYQDNSPKAHEPKSFADIFKEAANIRTKGKLRFIPPVFTEIGTKHANIPDELLMKQNEKWSLSLVGSFVGKRPAFPFVKFHAFRLWKKFGLVDVLLNDRGFFYFKFDNELGLQKVLDMRPWLFNDIPVLLKRWKVGIEFDKIRPTYIHLWANFYDLTPGMWNYEILSHIVSVLGAPIAIDRYTEEMCEKDKGRAAFARVLLKVNADQDLPPFVEAMSMGQMRKFRVQYLWKPDRCSHCNVFGHTFMGCPDRPKAAEELETTIPSTTTPYEAGPSGTKQVLIDSVGDQDFIQPKRRKRRPKKAHQAGGIVIPKTKVKYVPKATVDPKGKGIQNQPETTGSSNTSLPPMAHRTESSAPQRQVNTDIPETGNQFDALCDLNTDDVNSAPTIDAAADHQSTPTNAIPTDSTIFETRTTPDNPGIDSASLREEVDATKVVGGFFGLDLNDYDAEIEDSILEGY